MMIITIVTIIIIITKTITTIFPPLLFFLSSPPSPAVFPPFYIPAAPYLPSLPLPLHPPFHLTNYHAHLVPWRGKCLPRHPITSDAHTRNTPILSSLSPPTPQSTPGKTAIIASNLLSFRYSRLTSLLRLALLIIMNRGLMVCVFLFISLYSIFVWCCLVLYVGFYLFFF